MASDGGGDQRGAAFLQQVDGALGFGGECIEFGGFGVEEGGDGGLFIDWRHRNLYILQILDSDIALSVRIYLVFDTLTKCND